MKSFHLVTGQIVAGLLLVICQMDVASATSKASAIQFFSEVRNQNAARLREVDGRMQDRIQAGPSMSSPKENQQFDNEVASFASERRELVYRQDFLDRLLFQIDAKYTGHNFKAFLESATGRMAVIEAQSLQGQSNMWRFLSYLKSALRTLPERNENLLTFVETYMKQSTLSQPISPDKISQDRDYTNGAASHTAKAADLSEVGDLAESRVKVIEEQRPVLKSPEVQE